MGQGNRGNITRIWKSVPLAHMETMMCEPHAAALGLCTLPAPPPMAFKFPCNGGNSGRIYKCEEDQSRKKCLEITACPLCQNTRTCEWCLSLTPAASALPLERAPPTACRRISWATCQKYIPALLHQNSWEQSWKSTIFNKIPR